MLSSLSRRLFSNATKLFSPMKPEINIKKLKGFFRHDIAQLLEGDQNTGIELGVAQGVFSKRMIDSKKFNHFFGVDMYADHHDVSEYVNTIKLIGVSANFKLFRMTFEQALDLFEDEWFDFIYIDGYAHTGQEGGKTIHDWYKKLKRGGILAGDDYHPEWPLVVEQVNHFVRQHKLELLLTDQVEPDDSWSRYPTWATIKK